MKIARDVRRRRQRAANMAANIANGGARSDLKLDLNGLDDITVANGNIINNLLLLTDLIYKVFSHIILLNVFLLTLKVSYSIYHLFCGRYKDLNKILLKYIKNHWLKKTLSWDDETYKKFKTSVVRFTTLYYRRYSTCFELNNETK